MLSPTVLFFLIFFFFKSNARGILLENELFFFIFSLELRRMGSLFLLPFLLWLSFVSRDYQKNGGLSGFFFPGF